MLRFPGMPCSLRAPCGNQLTRMVEGPDFAVVECVHGHAFRLGAPPPPVNKHDVLASATKDIQDPGQWKEKLVAQGRCVRCKRKRGIKGTKHHCRRCADAVNRASLKRQRKKGPARRRQATQATKDEHARQMSGIRRKETAR